MNLDEWIAWTTRRLHAADLHYGHGTDCAEDEAAWLVLHAAGLSPCADVPQEGREVDAATAEAIETLLMARIEEAIPLAYLLGRAWFAGLEFEVTPAVLVPRSPIAELITDQFAPWCRPEKVRTVLDLCTGSGCIAIATAVHLPWVRVDAADISPEALAIARRNVERHGVADRVRLYESDLFAALQGRRYDVILTNPPYVPASGIARLPREYLAEPEIGLASGEDGLDACLRILAQAALHLESQGILVCEVGESQERLEGLLPSVPFLWLEFSGGGGGVFLLERDALLQAGPAVEKAIKERVDV